MHIIVMNDHPGEGVFPLFPKSSQVLQTGPLCTHYENWYPCTIDGHQTYVPTIFVRDGKLVRDYNPTELVCKMGETLEVTEIVYAWLFVKNAAGESGWFPAERACSGTVVS